MQCKNTCRNGHGTSGFRGCETKDSESGKQLTQSQVSYKVSYTYT